MMVWKTSGLCSIGTQPFIYKLNLKAVRSDSQLTALKTGRLLVPYVFSLVSFAP